jgi:hypothetical protein
MGHATILGPRATLSNLTTPQQRKPPHGELLIRPPFQSLDVATFPAWLWALRSDSIRKHVPFILEIRSAFFWNQLYVEGVEPTIEAVLAWCTGEAQPRPNPAEHAAILIEVTGTRAAALDVAETNWQYSGTMKDFQYWIKVASLLSEED